MKKITFFLVIIIALALSTPAFADREPPTVGERLLVYPTGEQSFPAEEPFHVYHGFKTAPNDYQAVPGGLNFSLEIDGVIQKPSFRYIDAEPRGEDPDWLMTTTVYNFPDGMTGEHTFKGHWYASCQLVYPRKECRVPSKPVEVLTTTVIFTFTTPYP